MAKPKCTFHCCRHGYLGVNTLTKTQSDHVRLYHRHLTKMVGFRGVVFRFRRLPSTAYEFVCECGETFPNPNSIHQHVHGKLPTSKDPCPVMCNKVLEIVTTGAICDDESLAINYWPEGAESDDDDIESVHVQSTDLVEDVQAESVVLVENVLDDSIHDQESVNLSSADLRNLLEENYQALADAITKLHKAQEGIKRALGNPQ